MNRFLRVFNYIVVILLAIAALAIFVTGFFTTIYYDMNVDVDFPHYKAEFIPGLVLSLLAVFMIFYAAYKKKLFEKHLLLIHLAFFFCIAYCMTLILAIKPLPVNDSKLIDDVLLQFADGDYSSLTSVGGYLYTWPFQLGYFLFGQIMDGIFGHGNYLPWDILQVIVIVFTVYLLYKITWELFEDQKLCGIMALLSMGMLFFYNYSTFIYGDILSMFPQTLALYFTVLYVKRQRIQYGLFAGIAIALAVLLKTNCEIAAIAMVVILLMNVIESKKSWKTGLLTMVFMLFAITALKFVVNDYYCDLTGLEHLPGGSPSASHIAMGLQESELEDGWYNSYNYDVFAENDYDTEKTKAVAIENIRERLNVFSRHPLYTIKFFGRKFLTQWADPVCISTHNLDLVSRHVENPTKLKDFIVFGKGSIILRWVMNVFMSVFYLNVLVYLYSRIRKQRPTTQEMLLLIFVFGGILFHQFWEGSSRYAMRYHVYWLPYAAFGMSRCLEYLDLFLRRFRNANKN